MPKKLQTRERLLDAGLDLLVARGYNAVGVQEIASAAGVPKGSFYNHFPSKEAFALEVLELYRAGACEALGAAAAGDGGPLERLRRLLEASFREMAEADFELGCLAGRLTQELAGEHEAFREPLENAFLCMRAVLTRLLAEAKGLGQLPADLDPEATAEFLFNAWQGATQRAKAAHSEAPLRNYLDLVFGRVLAPATSTT